jgi:hypothetical protein
LQESVKETKEEVNELLSFSKNEIIQFTSYSVNEIKKVTDSIDTITDTFSIVNKCEFSFIFFINIFAFKYLPSIILFITVTKFY